MRIIRQGLLQNTGVFSCTEIGVKRPGFGERLWLRLLGVSLAELYESENPRYAKAIFASGTVIEHDPQKYFFSVQNRFGKSLTPVDWPFRKLSGTVSLPTDSTVQYDDVAVGYLLSKYYGKTDSLLIEHTFPETFQVRSFKSSYRPSIDLWPQCYVWRMVQEIKSNGDYGLSLEIDGHIPGKYFDPVTEEYFVSGSTREVRGQCIAGIDEIQIEASTYTIDDDYGAASVGIRPAHISARPVMEEVIGHETPNGLLAFQNGKRSWTITPFIASKFINGG